MKYGLLRRLISSALFIFLAAECAISANADAFAPYKDLPFSDVSRDSWYFEYVKYAYDNFLTSGISEDTFAPLADMTRAMFVTVMGRLYGARGVYTDDFCDVESDSWYGGYVGWAVKNNIVNGFPDNTFRPDEPVTREQAVAIIGRFILLPNGKFPETGVEKATFKDMDKASHWATEYLETLCGAGIFVGDENGFFRPKDVLNRAEATAIITRLDKLTYARSDKYVFTFIN